MFLTAKAFFKDGTLNNTRILRRAETQIPEQFVALYKKNVRLQDRTPQRTGRLRRSIITQALGNRAEISWRAPYAKAQDEGGHTVNESVQGINPRTERYSTIKPGYYTYRNYTKPGTGPNFSRMAWDATQAQMPAVLRELGLVK